MTNAKPPKLPAWVDSLFKDAQAQEPKLTREEFYSEYIELDRDGEYRIKKKPEFEIVHCSWFFERARFGRIDQLDLFGKLIESAPWEKERVKLYGISAVGIDVTPRQHRVMSGAQKIISDTLKRNLSGARAPLEFAAPYQDPDGSPFWRVPPVEFTVECGAPRRRTERGKNEVVGWEYTKVLNVALHELNHKKFFLPFERIGPDGKVEIVPDIAEPFHFREVYDRDELTHEDECDIVEHALIDMMGKDAPPHLRDKRDKLGAKLARKLKAIDIKPHPYVLKLLDHEGRLRFVVKDASDEQKIKALAGKGRNAAKYPQAFVDLIYTEFAQRHNAAKAEQKVSWIMGHSKWGYKLDTLAHKLHMYPLLKGRNPQALRRAVERCAKLAKRLGYLERYQLRQDPPGYGPWYFVGVMAPDRLALNLEIKERYAERLKKAEASPTRTPPPTKRSTPPPPDYGKGATEEEARKALDRIRAVRAPTSEEAREQLKRLTEEKEEERRQAIMRQLAAQRHEEDTTPHPTD